MAENKYKMNKFFLQFHNKEIESQYIDYTINRNLRFCRIAWSILILLAGLFFFLDKPMFGDNHKIVSISRLTIILISMGFLLATSNKKLKINIRFSSFLFIISVGIFCILLIFLSEKSGFSPYFTGLFFAFTGILTTPGLGYKYSTFALLSVLIIFEITFGILFPLPTIVFTFYNFFLVGLFITFIYIGFLIEHIFRKNYATTSELKDSLSKVQKLSGMLPICAHCKNIRNDEGYWQKVEVYISKHSEAEFTHGLCPDCIKDLYGDKKWYQNYKKSIELKG